MIGRPRDIHCGWWEGCDQPVSEDGLCAFHFDACERSVHATRQRQHDAQQAAACAWCAAQPARYDDATGAIEYCCGSCRDAARADLEV